MREYLAGRGLGDEIAKEFRLGLSRGQGLVGEGARERLHRRGDPRRRAREPARERLLPVPADVPARGRARAGDRLPGTPAPRRRPAQGEVRQHARERALQEGQRPLRAPPGPARDREAGSRDRRRGEHRRDRASPGRGRAGRRIDGYRAHRGAAPRARSSDEAALPLLRRGRRRTGGDAAGDGARGQAGVRRPGRGFAEGRGSRRRAGLVRRTARLGRELPPLPRAHHARADARPPGGVRPGAGDPRACRGLARAPGGAAAARRPARPSARDPRGAGPRAVSGRRPPGGRGDAAAAWRRASSASATYSRRSSAIRRSFPSSPR